MIPPPLLAAGLLLTYMLVKSNEDKSNPVQPPPVVPNPVQPPPVVATKKRALETSPEASEKKKKTDLVYSAGFTADDGDDDVIETVPDKKKIDAAKMDEFVFIRDKIYFYRVKSDGKCLFRAIVAAMYYMQGNVVDMLLPEQTTKANDLRKQIVTFMFNNPEKFENALEKDESFKKYCDEMMNLNAMGGHTEVCAFHIMTGIQIDVYHLENETLTIMQSINEHCKDGVKDVVRLFYNGKDHWDMLYVTE
jgi:hypothetical protein